MSGLIIIIILILVIAFFINGRSVYNNDLETRNLQIDADDYKSCCRRGIELEELGRYK
jgi:hypothetical protein